MLCLSNRLIVEKIIQNFDFAELVVLRRVFSGSRRCVDLLKPDPKLVAMKISVGPGFILVELFGRNNDTTILYNTPGTDRSNIPSLNYKYKADINSFSDDLIQLLKHQTSTLKKLCITSEPWKMVNYSNTKIEDWKLSEDQFVEIFNKYIFLRGALIPVEKLNITTSSLKRAEQVLQNLNPVAIKTIEIQPTPWVTSRTIGHIEGQICLQQWINADELKIQSFEVECDLEKLVHFSKVDIFLYSITLEDVLYLKEKFLLSTNFRQFKAKLYKTDVDDIIFEENFLGVPFRRVDGISSDQPEIWFFPYTYSMEDLQIRYYRRAKKFMFKRVSRR